MTQLIWRALGNCLRPVDHENPIAVLGLVHEVCRYQNGRAPRRNGVYVMPELAPYQRIDTRSRFIKEQDAPYLLEQRIHNGNMRQFLEDNPETLPIGLNADTKYVISVRKPTNK